MADDMEGEQKKLVVETADLSTQREPDPPPIQEPDTTTLDREEAPQAVTLQPDMVLTELINSVLRKSIIKRAEAFVNPKTGAKTVYIFAEEGKSVKFVGMFDVTHAL